MTLTLVLPPEIEAKLKEQAARAGRDPQTLVLEALEQMLTAELPAPAKMLPMADWHSRFDAFIRSLPRSEATIADDSRETIYDTRGL